MDTNQQKNTTATSAAQAMDHASQSRYWSQAHKDEPYYNSAYDHSDYEPAYKLGYESQARADGGKYQDSEHAMSSEWEKVKGKSRLMWDDAKHAVRAAWHRVERAMPGDADNDGR